MENSSRKTIEAKLAALSEEIRRYPTPIARCDLQLPALLDERAGLMQALAQLDGQGSCSPAALWANDGGGQP